MINTIDGARGVRPELLQVARMLRLSRLETIRKIVLPAALPLAIVGLRLALSFALVLAIVAEVAGNPSGLGNAIVSAQQALRPDEMFVYVLAIGMLGVALNAGVRAARAARDPRLRRCPGHRRELMAALPARRPNTRASLVPPRAGCCRWRCCSASGSSPPRRARRTSRARRAGRRRWATCGAPATLLPAAGATITTFLLALGVGDRARNRCSGCSSAAFARRPGAEPDARVRPRDAARRDHPDRHAAASATTSR